MTALELAGTEALIMELSTRFDAMIFHGIKARPVDKTDVGSKVFCIRVGGDPHQCIGLAYGVMSYCQANLDSDVETLPAESL